MALQGQMYDQSVKTMLIIPRADYIFIRSILHNHLEYSRIETEAIE